MIVTLQTERIHTLEQVAAFVEAKVPVDFQPTDRASAYEFVARALSPLGYRALDKPSKALVKRFLARTTGYSRAQLTRLIRQYRQYHERPRWWTAATATRAGRSRGSTRRPTCAG